MDHSYNMDQQCLKKMFFVSSNWSAYTTQHHHAAHQWLAVRQVVHTYSRQLFFVFVNAQCKFLAKFIVHFVGNGLMKSVLAYNTCLTSMCVKLTHF